MRRLKLRADYNCFPLWEAMDFGERNVNPSDLPLGDATRNMLALWAGLFDHSPNQADPRKSGFASGIEIRNFERMGRRLWRRIQEELGPDYEVVYFSELRCGIMHIDYAPFSPRAGRTIDKLRFDPDASFTYHWNSGALVWSDEKPANWPTHQTVDQIDTLQVLWAYRASVIMGAPRLEFRDSWSQFERNYPDSPILRPERRSTELRPELVRCVEAMVKEIEEIEKEMDSGLET